MHIHNIAIFHKGSKNKMIRYLNQNMYEFSAFHWADSLKGFL